MPKGLTTVFTESGKHFELESLPTPESRIERVQDLTRGIGADVVVEVVGVAAATYEGLDIPASKIKRNQTKWVGTMHYNPWVIEAALQFLLKTKDKYQLIDVVSDNFPLEKVNEAFEFAEWQGKNSGTQAQRAALKP